MVAIQHQDVFPALLLSPDGPYRLSALAMGHSGIPHCHHYCDRIADRAASRTIGSCVRTSKLPERCENRPQRYSVCAIRSHPRNGYFHTRSASAHRSVFADVSKTPHDCSCCRDNRRVGSGGLRTPRHRPGRSRDSTRLYIHTRETAGDAECRVASRHHRGQHAIIEDISHFLEAAQAGPWSRNRCRVSGYEIQAHSIQVAR